MRFSLKGTVELKQTPLSPTDSFNLNYHSFKRVQSFSANKFYIHTIMNVPNGTDMTLSGTHHGRKSVTHSKANPTRQLCEHDGSLLT